MSTVIKKEDMCKHGLSATVAVFDFDGTLTYRDTLIPFLRHAIGLAGLIHGITRVCPSLLCYALGFMSNEKAKERLLSACLRNQRVEDLNEIGVRFARTYIPNHLNREIYERFKRHHASGHRCIIVSASLDHYLVPWAMTEGFEAVVCSRLVLDQGRVTGKLLDGNCYGPEKVRRLTAYLGELSQHEIYAYGDSKGDWPMLRAAKYPIYRGKPFS